MLRMSRSLWARARALCSAPLQEKYRRALLMALEEQQVGSGRTGWQIHNPMTACLLLQGRDKRCSVPAPMFGPCA